MKNKIINILISSSPIIVLLLYLVKGFAIYVDATNYNNTFLSYDTSVSAFEIIYVKHNLVFSRVMVIISLALILASIIGIGLSHLLKRKKPLYQKASLVVLLSSVVLLLTANINKFIPSSQGENLIKYNYFDFMTIPYLLAIGYVATMTYFAFKTKKD